MSQLKKLAVLACVVGVGLSGVSVFGQAKKITEPKEIPGLVLWLDAADAKSISKDAANKVSKWSDKSGKNLNSEQSDAAAQPIYNATALNQLPAIVFNGTTTVMNLDFGQKMFTAFVVGQRSQEVENPFERTEGGEHRGFVVGNQTETYNYFPEYRVNGVAAKAPSDWLNNIAVVTGVKGTQTPAGFKVGFGSPGYAPINGPLSEILIYERNLTADEIAAVEQYLIAKWKIKVAGK
jgi:hypothetical protein